jgi:hypothetical protein
VNATALAQLERDALDLVNAARRALGGGPLTAMPRGVPRCTKRCGIAACFADLTIDPVSTTPPTWTIAVVDGATIEFANSDYAAAVARAWGQPNPASFTYGVRGLVDRLRVVDLPEQLQDYAAAFDDGRFPHLVREGAAA